MLCDYHWCPAPKQPEGQKNKHMLSVVTPSLTQDFADGINSIIITTTARIRGATTLVNIHKSWTGLLHAKIHQEKVRKGGRESDAQHQTHMNSRHARVVAVLRPEPVSSRLPVLSEEDDDDPDNSGPPPPPRRRHQILCAACSPTQDPDPPEATYILEISHMGGHCSDEDELYTTPHGTRRQIRRRVAPEIGTRKNPWDLSTPVANVKAEPLTPKELPLNRTPAYLRNIGIADTPPPIFPSPPGSSGPEPMPFECADRFDPWKAMQNVQDWRLLLQPSKIPEVSHIQMDDVDWERGKFFLLPEISVGEEAWMGSQSSDGGDQTAAEEMDDPLVVLIAFEVDAVVREIGGAFRSI
ncbi:hypothetical protein FN846DRAFT_902443 [Sphaerosporella brunnea]|uniref:Uncharacterized protein n=1 Tax=Sphaerosporella brunnea TaxID=1250544 RepID=A0A5J5FAV3_9PEZI|nr:hypothetical protein FN846DRAFT_902443 [Sphaerosporella brunnea]